MSSVLERETGKEEEAPEAATSQWCWSRISPSHLDHRQQVPTAITLHRLVPCPSVSLHQPDATVTTTTSTFKYITPEEIKAAQIRARQEILASRLAPSTLTSSDIPVPPSSQNKKHGPGSQPSFSCRLGNGEVGLRRRQLTRLISQILRTLVDLQDLKGSCQKDFVAPLELEIRRRRWNECARLMKRSLYVLRQEVVVLERGNRQGVRNTWHLRALAAVARTLNTQLMTLKSHAESSCGNLDWTEVLEEFLGVARRVLVLTASVGVQPPSSSIKCAALTQERVAAAPGDRSSLESAVSISDVDSTNVHLLQSGHVRDKLARLAALHLKKRKKHRSSKSTVTERRQSKEDIVLQPLKNHLDNRDNTSLDTVLTHQSPANPILLKGGDNSTTGIGSPHKNISPDHHSQPSVPRTSIVDPQPHYSSFRTNSPADPHPHPSLTQTNNVSESHSQPSQYQNEFSDPETYTNTVPQASLLTPGLTQQLSFLLERVCKLEDSRRRTEALIAEASQATCTQDVTPTLDDAVQRARLMLATVKGATPHTQPPVSNTGITVGDSLLRNSGLSRKVPEGVLLRTKSGTTGAHHQSEEVGKAVSTLERNWLAGESVIEQVRQKKEQFWLSLAEQGFVRPPETFSHSGEDLPSAVQHSNQPGNGKVFNKNTSDKSAEEKFDKTLKKTDVPMGHSPKKAAVRTQLHQQTEKEIPAELHQSSNKTGSSSDPSHHSPLTNSKTQHSPSNSQFKLDVSAGNAKQSVSTESQLQQRLSVDTTSSGMPSSTETESQSFPSYEGISNPA